VQQSTFLVKIKTGLFVRSIIPDYEAFNYFKK